MQPAIGQIAVLETSSQAINLIQPAIAVITAGAVGRIVKLKIFIPTCCKIFLLLHLQLL